MAKIILRAGKVAIKIIIPFAILGLIFYSVKVLVPAKANVESFPEELAAQFDQAEAYREQGRYTEVEQIYQSIIEQYPLTDYDFEAQTQLTILYINWNKPADADAALEELTSSFYEHPGIAQAILAIAGSYYDVGKYENALELYEYTMSTWPDNAIWAGAGIIRANIVLGNDPNVPEAVDELLEQFSGSEFIVEAVLSIAGSYYYYSAT